MEQPCGIQMICAGGGLVRNDSGEYLLIYRNGRWDLPKGHQEQGESISHTALREVQEECALAQIRLGKFIACTRHSYWLNNILIFKQTHWYHMFVDGRPALGPQTEEGIEQCLWCTAQDAAKKLSSSYPSIQWLFRRATGIKTASWPQQ